MSVQSQLRSLLLAGGLSEAESTIYLELLDKPAENVWDLVNRTKLSKSTVYRAFESLKAFKMVNCSSEKIEVASLKNLVANLRSAERRIGKVADKIKQIAPFLRAPKEAIEVFDQYYSKDEITEAYLSMSKLNYKVCLDMGDFEAFVPILSDSNVAFEFRNNRMKHAVNHAICTSFGPYTAQFCTREAEVKFKNKVDCLNINFKKKFVVFSDTNDYVLFNEFSDKENPSSVMVKSKTIADIQRTQFANFSQLYGNG